MTEVSVIIPTYNRCQTLRYAIDSALSQTIDDIEIIIVDDGSTDKTPEVVRTYDDQRIRFVQHYKNKGASTALNTGIDQSTGEYIARLDSDDWWYPIKLERQIEELKTKSSDWIACYCDFYFDDETRSKFIIAIVSFLDHMFSDAGTHPEGQQDIIQDILKLRASIIGSALLIERNALESVNGYDQRYRRHTDYELLMRLAKIGNISYVDESLVVREITSSPDPKVVEAAKKLLFEDYASEIRELEEDNVPITEYHRFSLAKKFFHDGNFVQGMKYLRQGKAATPIDYFELLYALVFGIKKI